MDTNPLPIYQNKIKPPRLRPGRIHRADLVQRIEAGLWTKVTLISSPAGFGKTTLLGDWSKSSQRKVCWFLLDDQDNLIHNFITYLVAAFRIHNPEFGDNLLQLLNQPEPETSTQLVSLIVNELEQLTEAFVLVLDDYQVIQNNGIHQLVNEIVSHLPDNINLVISSREDPPLPLAKLRANNEINEIRQNELRFRLEDASLFLTQLMGLQIQSDQIEKLVQRTEGWIAGMQLAALSIKDSDHPDQLIEDFTGSNKYILDYLMTEVLDHLDSSTKHFLLRCSILSRLTQPLCDQITNDIADSPQLVDLEADNLFIQSIDQEKVWYRIHPLFADLLKHRQNWEYTESQIKEFYRLAAAWETNNDLFVEAVFHYIAAGDMMEAGNVAQVYSSSFLEHSEASRCVSWLDALPSEVTNPHIGLQFIYCYALISNSKFVECVTHANQAQRLLDIVAPYIPPEQIEDLQARIMSVKGLVAAEEGKLEEAEIYLGQALKQLDITDPVRTSLGIGLAVALEHNGRTADAVDRYKRTWEENTHPAQLGPRTVSICNRGMLLIGMGMFTEADHDFQTGIAASQDAENDPILTIAYAGMATMAYYKNDLVQMNQHLKTAERLIEKWGNIDIRGAIYTLRVQYFLSNGDLISASAALETTEKYIEQSFVRQLSKDSFLQTKLRVLIATNQHGGIVRILKVLSKDCQRSNAYFEEPLWITRSMAEIMINGNLSQDTLQAMHLLHESAAVNGRVLTKLTSQFLLLAGTQHLDSTQRDFEEIIREVKEIGCPRIVIDLEPVIGIYLSRAAQSPDPVIAAYVNSLLKSNNLSHKNSLPSNPNPEVDLSPREIEVLHLVAAGLSNTLIANRLFLSPGTVKRHLHNIFEKLGADSRVSAISIARSKNMLD